MERGVDNLERHLGIARAFGLNAVVAVNGFPGDDRKKLERLCALALERGAWAAEINDGRIDKAVKSRARALGFEVNRQTIELGGLCPRCRKAGARGRARNQSSRAVP